MMLLAMLVTPWCTIVRNLWATPRIMTNDVAIRRTAPHTNPDELTPAVAAAWVYINGAIKGRMETDK